MIIGLLGVALGGGAIIALAAWAGLATIGAELREAAWAVAPAIGLMLAQLWLSAVAWRVSVGARAPRVSRYFRIRWIREAVNTMLPVAQLGGNLVGIRMLAQRGVPGPVAGAGTTLDITVEVVTQFLFTLLGFAVLAISDAGADEAWVGWSLAAMAAVAGAFVLAQRAGLLRIVEALIVPIRRVFPGVTVESVRGLHAELMRLHRDRRALLAAGALHLAAWLLGVVETWIALWAMDVPAGWGAALVIESLAMAARSAGFAVPGALGVQEAGFVLVSGLFGIAPDQAIALSMVKRARELAVGVAGLVMWQWSEGRRLVGARRLRSR